MLNASVRAERSEIKCKKNRSFDDRSLEACYDAVFELRRRSAAALRRGFRPSGTGSWRWRENSGRFAGSRLLDTLRGHCTRSPHIVPNPRQNAAGQFNE
jgi:hypothetical protein